MIQRIVYRLPYLSKSRQGGRKINGAITSSLDPTVSIDINQGSITPP